MRRPYIAQMRDFQCNECGARAVAPKRKRRMTPVGHQKHMYCYKCMQITQHTQIE